MTIAAQVSALLHNDGQCWRTDDGRDFDQLVEAFGATHDGDGFDKHRYTFSDHSVITVSGDAWDLGFSTCWCWAGVVEQDGHLCKQGLA